MKTKQKLASYKDYIKKLSKYKKDNYHIEIGSEVIPVVHMTAWINQNASLKHCPIKSYVEFYDDEGEIKCKCVGQQVLLSKEFIEANSPLNIDNAHFWKVATKHFPLYAICGMSCETIIECNDKTLDIPKHFKFLDFIDFLIENSSEKIDFLEIGYGYGNIFKHYNNKTNYIGIDYNRLPSMTKHKNLLKIKESGIPYTIPDFSQDIVYACNVFQHCSQKDRFDYIQQAYDKLRYGGYMIFVCFLDYKAIEDSPVWGNVDEEGRKYCVFFNQLTKIDTEEELLSHIHKVGFEVLSQQPSLNKKTENMVSFVLQKRSSISFNGNTK